jgi:uncharacterized membrane protein YvbJ
LIIIEALKMKKCYLCGFDLLEGSQACPHCGTSAAESLKKQKDEMERISSDDSAGCLAVISFLFPIVGLIGFLVLMASRPRTAKLMGKAALISTILSVGLSLIFAYLFSQ